MNNFEENKEPPTVGYTKTYKYRIVEKDGVFYPQKRFWVFWINMLREKNKAFPTYDKAENYVDNHKNRLNEKVHYL